MHSIHAQFFTSTQGEFRSPGVQRIKAHSLGKTRSTTVACGRTVVFLISPAVLGATAGDAALRALQRSSTVALLAL
jgi:hypothetical protein